MKKSSKKLSLNRETLRNLHSDELARAAGGATSPSHGITYCNCPSVQVCPTLDPTCVIKPK